MGEEMGTPPRLVVGGEGWPYLRGRAEVVMSQPVSGPGARRNGQTCQPPWPFAE